MPHNLAAASNPAVEHACSTCENKMAAQRKYLALLNKKKEHKSGARSSQGCKNKVNEWADLTPI